MISHSTMEIRRKSQQEAQEQLTGGCGKDTSEERAEHATDSMQLEHVHALIDMKPVVNVGEELAPDSSKEANHSCKPDTHEAGSRRDADETSDGSFASPNYAESAFMPDVVDQHLR